MIPKSCRKRRIHDAVILSMKVFHMSKMSYWPLEIGTISKTLWDIIPIREKLGGNWKDWKIREVGDGNLNLVFIVEGPETGLVVKQALPYVRLVGESWPLPLERAYYEANALRIQTQFAPGLTPKVFHTDKDMALIVMEYLNPHLVLRKGLIKGIRYQHAAKAISEFMALTLFHTSVLASTAAEHKARIALFAPNTALCKITEDLVFTDPYREAQLNQWTRPYLDSIKLQFENDVPLKLAVQRKKWQFMTEAQGLIHGDLHSGSIMVTDTDTRMIDPEFAFVGPMGFDVGAVIANLLLAFFAYAGRKSTISEGDYASWLLQQVDKIWTIFEQRFLALWSNHATGDAFANGLFETEPAEQQLHKQQSAFMKNLFHETLEFAGCKMIRRILGLAHVEDLESIADLETRARCETYALHFARELVMHGQGFLNIEDVTVAASAMLKGKRL